MLFALNCTDKPDSLQLRLDTRPAHLEFLKAATNLVFAGPYIENDKPVGSLVVIEAESLAEAEAFAAADPYAQAGLFDSVSVREWRKVFG